MPGAARAEEGTALDAGSLDGFGDGLSSAEVNPLGFDVTTFDMKAQRCLVAVLMKVCDIDRDTAIRTIKSAGKSIPIAVVMLKANVDKMEAVRRLTKSDGNVRLAIDDSRLEL